MVCFRCSGHGTIENSAVAGGPYPQCPVCRGIGRISPDVWERFGIIRKWVRERADALNVPPYRLMSDRKIVDAARLELPAAAWCVVAPCR